MLLVKLYLIVGPGPCDISHIDMYTDNVKNGINFRAIFCLEGSGLTLLKTTVHTQKRWQIFEVIATLQDSDYQYAARILLLGSDITAFD